MRFLSIQTTYRPLLAAGLLAASFSPVFGQAVRIDFGPNDGTNGNPTNSPDANGNYWNNVAQSGAVANGLSVSNMVTTDNTPTSIGVKMGSGWSANGIKTGGLLAPSPALLGDIAIDTATQDYFFIQNAGSKGRITVSGLNPAKLYTFRFFGTRDTTDNRQSTYKVTAGSGITSVPLQTSGAGIGSAPTHLNGNDKTIVQLDNVQADASKQIQLEVSVTGPGAFAYLGVMEIIEGPDAPPLPLSKIVRVDFGPNDGTNGNPTQNPDANGRYWNNFAISGTVPNGSGITRLFATDNTPTPIGLAVGTNWNANGILTGGLLNPKPALLGEFAVNTVTQDYFYLSGVGVKGTVTISGLNPEKLYNLRMFGTRDTTDFRETTYTVTAAGGSGAVALQTSGAGSGSAGNGNDDTIVSLDNVQADTSSQVRLEVAVTGGAFAYINALEIAEVGDAPRIPTSRTVRIDFGRDNGTDGNPTTGADANGNYWNNFVAGFDVTPGQWASSLVAVDNSPTAINLAISTGWKANGRANGGLIAPDGPNPALLGDLAIETATEDYYFVEGGGAKATMTLTGLDPAKRYNLRMFGTRNAADVRQTTYKATTSNGSVSTALQTSGPRIGSNGVYNGNDNNIVVLPEIQPGVSKEIQLEVSTTGGGFSYLAALEITESSAIFPLLPVSTPGDFARWTAQDALDPVAPGSVVFVGSSSIRRWEQLQRDFADYRITQRGFGGSLIVNLDNDAGYVVRPYQPSAIVIWSGTNDIKGLGRSGAQVNADFLAFVGNVRTQQANVPIFYLGIAPTPGYAADSGANARRRDANTLISATCAGDPLLHYIDLPSFFEDVLANNPAEFQSYYVDDTHFSKKGYDVWKTIVRPVLGAVVPPNKVFIANSATLAGGENLLFDFGPSDGTNGDATLGADVNGHIWNNWHATNGGGGGVTSGEHLANLVKTSGADSGIRMTITGQYLVNGKLNGGLFAPQPSLLGDLAVESATEDYFFSNADDLYDLGNDDNPGGFMIEGLNPSLTYELRIFGSRENTETRVTEHAVFGATTVKKNLQTSGMDIGSDGAYDGNDDKVAVIAIMPDEFGQIFVDQTVAVSQFAYINAMQITALVPTSALESWRTLHFTPEELANPALEATLYGNAADPDGDGRSNLLEYATGTDPRSAGATVETVEMETVGPDSFLTLTFLKNMSATDLSFQVETAEDLATWNDIPDTFLSIEGGIETRKATVPAAGFPKRFLRLKVEIAD